MRSHFIKKQLLLLLPFLVISITKTHGQNTFKFKVQKSVSRFQDENGKWGQWAPFGDLNKKVDQHFIFDYSLNKIFWYTHAEGVEPRITEFLISETKTDSSFKDFGVWCTIYRARSKTQEKHLFRMLYSDGEENSNCVLIVGEEIFQSKHYLIIVPHQ